MYDAFGQPIPRHAMRLNNQSSSPRHRSVTVPMPIPLPSPSGSQSLMPSGPASAGPSYYDPSKPHSSGSAGGLHGPFALNRQGSNSSLASSHGGLMRPSSSSRRFDPYNSASTSPRATTAGSMHVRRPSQPMIIPPGGPHSGSTGGGGPGSDYFSSSTYDLKPPISPGMDPSHDQQPHSRPQTYSYPSSVSVTTPSFSDFGTFGSSGQQLQSPGGYTPTYTAWHQPSPSSIGRALHGDSTMSDQSHSYAHPAPPQTAHPDSQSGDQTLGMMIQPNNDVNLDDPSWPSGDDPNGMGGGGGGGSATGMGMMSPLMSPHHHHHHHHPHGHAQVQQGWEGQYVGDNGDWRGQGTSVG